MLIRSFLSYFMITLIFIAVAGIGAAIGIYLRKRKDANAPEIVTEDSE